MCPPTFDPFFPPLFNFNFNFFIFFSKLLVPMICQCPSNPKVVPMHLIFGYFFLMLITLFII